MFDDDDPYWAARMRMTPDEMEALKRKAAQQTRDAYDAATRAMAEAGEAAKGWWDEAENVGDRFKAGLAANLHKLLGGTPTEPTANLPLRGPIYPRPRAARAPQVSNRWQEPAAPVAGPEACVLTWPLDPKFGELNSKKGKQGDGRFGDGVTGIVRYDHEIPRKHEGMDITAPLKTPIHAAAPGVIRRQDNRNPGGYGWQIEIDHGNGLSTKYAHLDPNSLNRVVIGQEVGAGHIIGATGVSGNPVKPEDGGDPHLHFEVRRRGKAVPPNGFVCPPGILPRSQR
ncbi:MAG TPA: M23 family metallopeptidase [Phenylobacterium sp.]|nr:M23 family metallopeptidase [Phenylobacterium sp.]